MASDLMASWRSMPLAQKILWFGFAVYVSILPVGATTALRNLMFALVLATLGYLLWKAKQRPQVPIGLPWLAFLLPALFSLSYSVDVGYSLGEIKTEIAFPFFIFAMAATVVSDEKSFLRFLTILTVANLFLVAFSVATGLTGGSTKDYLVGTLNTGVGYYSTYLVAVMPFIAVFFWHARSQSRTLASAALLLLMANLASLYISGNRQGLLAVLVEIGVFVIFVRKSLTRRHWAIIALAALSVGLLFLFQFANRDPSASKGLGTAMSNDVRWPVWRACIEELVAHPWTGSGFGLRIFQIAYPQFSANGPFWHAHNVLLNKGIQMGVPGVIGFLLLFFSVPKAMFASRRLHGMAGVAAVAGVVMSIGFLLKNMTDDFFYRESGYVFWLLSGAVLGLCCGARNESGSRLE